MRWKLKTKKFIRYICIGLICLASIFTGGCAKTTSDVSSGFYDIWIDYLVFEYPSGTIVQKYTVDVNEERLHDNGRRMTASQIADLELNIKQTFTDFYFTETFSPRYNEIEEQVRARTDINLEEKYDYLAGFKCDVNISNEGEIVAQRTFDSIKHYRHFYEGTDSITNPDVEKRSTLLFNQYVSGRKNVYYYNIEKFNNFWGIDPSNVYLTETYASANGELKSNADLVETSQGIKMHQWEISTVDRSIEFYTYVPIAVNWYVMALILTGFFTLMLAIFSISRIDETKPPTIKLKKKETFINLRDLEGE